MFSTEASLTRPNVGTGGLLDRLLTADVLDLCREDVVSWTLVTFVFSAKARLRLGLDTFTVARPLGCYVVLLLFYIDGN